MATPLRERITKYILISLIITFFAIPLAALCLFNCKIFKLEKIPSLFLFLFQ